MDFDQLKTFVELVNLKSYSKTAVHLHISQPTVSSRIKTMEEELKQKLIQRNGKELKLTAAGEYFYNSARQLVNNFEEAGIMLREFSTYSEFSVGVTPLCANYCLTHIIPVLQSHPQYVPMNIRTVSQPHQLLEMFSRGIIDVAILSSYNYTSKNCELLWNEPTALVSNPTHTIANRSNPVSFELADYPVALLGTENANHFGQQLIEIFQEKGIDFHPQVIIDNYNIAKQLVKQSSLISFLPLLCVEDEIKSGQFVSIPYEYPKVLSSKIYLFYRANAHNALFKHFYSLLKEFSFQRQIDIRQYL